MTAADEAPRPVATPPRVGVLGGGRMGAGIAHAFLLAGSEVTVVERDTEAAEAARGRILTSIADSTRRGATDRSEAELAASVHLSTDVTDFAGAGLVVEAVPEDRRLKRDALARIEAIVARDAVIATNTSSIGIAALADTLQDPARFLGLHFFNPVPASRLVEIVVGDATAAGVVERARGWVDAIGKTPIVVSDAPGFASSRLGLALALEAIRMVEAGVASPADIDAAMELGYRHPAGPLRTTDIVGLDVRLAIAEELHATLGDRFAPPDLLRRMVADGHLGRKTGRGFYEWSTP
ncbi:3-hydroxybutyryl-CoA dehydrogenase [Microbacterium sp. AK009]|uniref:3-hydroxyacyl-CoA dehydrogenase family protein n=1 Tax=Microbacterium sp. AK009 TaxID=2723068 RepID=UPI0015CC3429|nr:3-hydroxyacyl-CoA dehydrogenase family protein [Microbacterium sp. AK009]NYF16685.1 3-hydroxybutyryl-CoA dehydrogenase [Microbacterium sp. AK009]